MKFQFKLAPSATSVVDKVERAALNVRRRYDDAMSELADRCVEGVKKRIDAQIFAPLKEGYLLRKRAAGLDARILIATQDYYDGIKKERIAIGEYGVKANMVVAKWMEDGGKDREPRPHWRPTLAELEQASSEIMGRLVVNDLP